MRTSSTASVMALFICLNLHPVLANDLIRKAGYDIYSRTSEEYIAYQYLVNHLHMENIEKWNEILSDFGLKPIP